MPPRSRVRFHAAPEQDYGKLWASLSREPDERSLPGSKRRSQTVVFRPCTCSSTSHQSRPWSNLYTAAPVIILTNGARTANPASGIYRW